MAIIYNKLKITLATHAAAGLTENDFIMAKIIDELG
jgi:pterin-4a-carbinolamine dehydratase